MDEFDIIDNMTNGNVCKMSFQNGKDALEVLDYIDSNSSEFVELKSLIWSRIRLSYKILFFFS